MKWHKVKMCALDKHDYMLVLQPQVYWAERRIRSDKGRDAEGGGGHPVQLPQKEEHRSREEGSENGEGGGRKVPAPEKPAGMLFHVAVIFLVSV